MPIHHDPHIMALAFFFASLVLMIFLGLLFVWWRNHASFDGSDVPCDMYGICQRRLDCNDAHCEGHPRNGCKAPRQSNVIRIYCGNNHGKQVDTSKAFVPQATPEVRR